MPRMLTLLERKRSYPLQAPPLFEWRHTSVALDETLPTVFGVKRRQGRYKEPAAPRCCVSCRIRRASSESPS
jgi:hypothetical protein